MIITIEINETKIRLKKAIVKGCGASFNGKFARIENITDIRNKYDILGAIPYLDSEKIRIL